MGGSVTGEDGPKQRKILFEYASFIDWEQVRILTLNRSELLKESRTSYRPYLSVLVRSVTRKTMKTCRLYASSRRTSGTLSSSTRSILIFQSLQYPWLRQPAASPAGGVVRSKL